jgi:hypothetical protein
MAVWVANLLAAPVTARNSPSQQLLTTMHLSAAHLCKSRSKRLRGPGGPGQRVEMINQSATIAPNR